MIQVREEEVVSPPNRIWFPKRLKTHLDNEAEVRFPAAASPYSHPSSVLRVPNIESVADKIKTIRSRGLFFQPL